jgi:hypothetical protein
VHLRGTLAYQRYSQPTGAAKANQVVGGMKHLRRVRIAHAALRAEQMRLVDEEMQRAVKSLPTTTPISRSIATPQGLVQVCPGSEQEGPARSGVPATSPTERSAGGTCLPTGASRGGTAVQVRFLNRQLSLPVSTMSQWCVRRSSSAVVILASPNTWGQSAKARLVVISSEVFS